MRSADGGIGLYIVMAYTTSENHDECPETPHQHFSIGYKN